MGEFGPMAEEGESFDTVAGGFVINRKRQVGGQVL